MRIDKFNTRVNIQPANAKSANSRRSNSGLANVSQLVDLAIQKKGIRGDTNLTESEREFRLKGLNKLSDPIHQSVAADQVEKFAGAMVDFIKANQTEIENATKSLEGEEIETIVNPDESVKPDAANDASPAPAADIDKHADVRAATTINAGGTTRPASLGQNVDTHA